MLVMNAFVLFLQAMLSAARMLMRCKRSALITQMSTNVNLTLGVCHFTHGSVPALCLFLFLFSLF